MPALDDKIALMLGHKDIQIARLLVELEELRKQVPDPPKAPPVPDAK